MSKPKLLLHSCCAPCSSAILEYLNNYYDITLLFYNPCITNMEEYSKRSNELIRLVNDLNLGLRTVIAPFSNIQFLNMAKVLENEPECGKRCKLCYAQRLQYTASYAKENGFKEFSTTLTISPYKNSSIINDIGIKIAQANNLTYLAFDFGFLYTRSLDLSEKYNLYQQDYCGCEYSKN